MSARPLKLFNCKVCGGKKAAARMNCGQPCSIMEAEMMEATPLLDHSPSIMEAEMMEATPLLHLASTHTEDAVAELALG